jgi:hypothetical protein
MGPLDSGLRPTLGVNGLASVVVLLALMAHGEHGDGVVVGDSTQHHLARPAEGHLRSLSDGSGRGSAATREAKSNAASEPKAAASSREACFALVGLT